MQLNVQDRERLWFRYQLKQSPVGSQWPSSITRNNVIFKSSPNNKIPPCKKPVPKLWNYAKQVGNFANSQFKRVKEKKLPISWPP